MYRVYDKQEEKWLEDGIYLSPLPQSDLYILKKNFFGNDKLISVIEYDRYIIQKFIDLYDRDSEMIYEGDILEAQISDDITVTGVVVYAPELAGYIILCFNPDEFYVLGSDISKHIKVLGNCIDNPELLPEGEEIE